MLKNCSRIILESRLTLTESGSQLLDYVLPPPLKVPVINYKFYYECVFFKIEYKYKNYCDN